MGSKPSYRHWLPPGGQHAAAIVCCALTKKTKANFYSGLGTRAGEGEEIEPWAQWCMTSVLASGHRCVCVGEVCGLLTQVITKRSQQHQKGC